MIKLNFTAISRTNSSEGSTTNSSNSDLSSTKSNSTSENTNHLAQQKILELRKTIDSIEPTDRKIIVQLVADLNNLCTALQDKSKNINIYTRRLSSTSKALNQFLVNNRLNVIVNNLSEDQKIIVGSQKKTKLTESYNKTKSAFENIKDFLNKDTFYGNSTTSNSISKSLENVSLYIKLVALLQEPKIEEVTPNLESVSEESQEEYIPPL